MPKSLLAGLREVAQKHPELRKHLVPLIRQASGSPQYKEISQLLQDALTALEEADRKLNHLPKDEPGLGDPAAFALKVQKRLAPSLRLLKDIVQGF